MIHYLGVLPPLVQVMDEAMEAWEGWMMMGSSAPSGDPMYYCPYESSELRAAWLTGWEKANTQYEMEQAAHDLEDSSRRLAEIQDELSKCGHR